MNNRYLAPNSLIGNRYQIVRLLAEGGMATVYQATDQRLGGTVALKRAMLTNDYLPVHFEHEAHLLASLRHRSLPRVTDKFNDENGYFLVMDFIDGQDLKSLLEERGLPFPHNEVLDWAEQLLEVLDYLHSGQMPVFHRDIKPLNLKVNSQGTVILLDFGLAKGVAPGLEHPAADKTLLGCTPEYAPLEQFIRADRCMYEETSLSRNVQLREIMAEHTDARVDLYSLGATIYHLMTGVTPVTSKDRYLAMQRGESDPLLLANEVCPVLPSEVAVFLMQAMAIIPERRFVSAKAMMRALQELRGLINIEAKTKSQLTTLPMSDREAEKGQDILRDEKSSKSAQEFCCNETRSIPSEDVSQPCGAENDKEPREAKPPSQSTPKIWWLKSVSPIKKEAGGNSDIVMPRTLKVIPTPRSPILRARRVS